MATNLWLHRWHAARCAALIPSAAFAGLVGGVALRCPGLAAFSALFLVIPAAMGAAVGAGVGAFVPSFWKNNPDAAGRAWRWVCFVLAAMAAMAAMAVAAYMFAGSTGPDACRVAL